MTTTASPLRDKSAALTGASQTIFTDAGFNGIEERFLANPNAANPIWVNALGGAAVANGQGSFLLAAGGYWATKHTGVVNVIGTAADKITAGER